jgi:DNA-directed RNA polymerase specialized sigma24 family protein
VARRPLPALPSDFESFFRADYLEALRIVLYVGATMQEAEDAVQIAMEEAPAGPGWIANRSAYARRAAVSNFLKEKARGLDRIRGRLERADAGRSAGADHGLTVWEDGQWVKQLLESLPAAQRKTRWRLSSTTSALPRSPDCSARPRRRSGGTCATRGGGCGPR